jgi:DNA-binding beta-propeller fold protein YncE
LDGSGTVYVAELGGAIRAVTSGGEASTLAVAGTFNAPIGLALDGAGYLYVAAQGLGSANAPGVFRFNIASAAAAAPGSGLVLELVGSSWGAGPTPLSYPDGLAIDGQGNVYVADGGQSIIVKYTPGATAGSWTGARMAGQAGASGYRDGNAASQALFDAPGGLALDAVSGYLFVADADNNLIRAISPGAGAMVTTVAGSPLLSGTVPGMLPATFFYPMGLALNPSSRELVITVPDAVLELQ